MTPRAPKTMVSPIATSTSNAPSVSPLNNWAQSKGQFIAQPSELFRLPSSSRWHVAAYGITWRHNIQTGRETHDSVEVIRIAHFAWLFADYDRHRTHLLVIALAEVN